MSVSRGMRRKLESYSQLSIPKCKWPNSNPLYGLDEVTLCVRYVLKSLYAIIEQPISNVLPCN